MKMNGNRRLQPFLLKTCCIITLFISLIALGCGKDKVKPSEDSMLAQGALRSLERIKEAYETKNIDSVRELAESGLVSSLKRELKFDNAGLSFSTPRIIKITASYVTVSVNWQGEWELGGVTRKNRGSSNFLFLKDSMRLAEIVGDNPFAVPAVNVK